VFSSANQAAPTNQPAKFYDMGQFQLVANGCQAASPAGELWVEHEWTLIRRKQETPIGQQVLYAHVVEGPAASAAAAGSAFLGTSGGILRAGSTIPVVSTSSTFTLPIAGVFLIASTYNGSATVVDSYSLGANITVGPLVLIDNTAGGVEVVAGGISNGVRLLTVSANGTGAANTVTISGLTNLAAGKVDIFISQVSGAILLALQKSGKTCSDDKSLQAIMERLFALENQRNPVLPRISCVSEPDTPCEEIKGDELESSVHISKSTAEQLLRGLGLRK